MPIYEFSCPACGSRFEQLTDSATRSASCPSCGDGEAKRVLSAPAPVQRLVLSRGEARKREDKRGIDREGAKQRFRERRAAERREPGGRG
jgi:putative FmdB family regulatory protein